MKFFAFGLLSLSILTLWACSGDSTESNTTTEEETSSESTPNQSKLVVYQVFTRLFGNKNTTNKMWGTMEENGVGKFDDFTDTALQSIKRLGVTHIWYTGVPHHAVIRDYTKFGISDDDPDVVKGRAGSPYAVKDYYNVNPDLATDPAKRLEEFQALIKRTHQNGMKVIIDIVPNHVARNYISISKPQGIKDFGENDNKTVEYARNNNFYYIPNEPFQVPESLNDYRPLGGEKHPLADGKFDENPAKWTGNGSRKAQPHFHDWYETVKVNYGIKPDGTKDFDTLPPDFAQKNYEEHFAFWQDKDVPDSWIKFRDIALYWIEMGVDGFRYDMAEMVPVEFWSYMNSAIKTKNSDTFIMAEVYNPDLYRDYIRLGKMDYLYDKVGLYDVLKPIMQGKSETDKIVQIQESVLDIEQHLLHFLENHDEQRIASSAFAGDAQKGKPAMVVSTLLSRSPTMIYFGQEVGEAGYQKAGFGDSTRTTIFDYWGVPEHQKWMNDGTFDGGQLTDNQRDLRQFYVNLLRFSATSQALLGEYQEIHTANRQANKNYDQKLFSFVRWNQDEKLIIVSNFDAEKQYDLPLVIPVEIIEKWKLDKAEYEVTDQLYQQFSAKMTLKNGVGEIMVKLAPLESLVLKITK